MQFTPQRSHRCSCHPKNAESGAVSLARGRLVLAALAMAVCASVSPAAAAQTITPQVVGLHLASVHSTSGREAPGARGWNNANVGVYARWDSGLTAGVYRNSLFRTSTYVGWTVHDAADRFALTLGAVSGYDRVVITGGDHVRWRCQATCRPVNLQSIYLPLLVPSVRIPLTGITSARIALMAAPGEPVAAHLSIEARF